MRDRTDIALTFIGGFYGRAQPVCPIFIIRYPDPVDTENISVKAGSAGNFFFEFFPFFKG
jgi:hypothetical protein